MATAAPLPSPSRIPRSSSGFASSASNSRRWPGSAEQWASNSQAASSGRSRAADQGRGGGDEAVHQRRHPELAAAQVGAGQGGDLEAAQPLQGFQWPVAAVSGPAPVR